MPPRAQSEVKTGMLTFRLIENLDPEERLEEAALWKAMFDEYGNEIAAVTGDAPATFGRLRKREGLELRYWDDPAFLKHCQRSFATVPLEQVGTEVAKLHERGVDAFVKSTRGKHYIVRVPVGTSWHKAAGDMVYSFIDGGPHLMVQESCIIESEHRFFVIDRDCVTHSENKPELSPLDFPVKQTSLERSEFWPLQRLALDVAREMREPHAVVDVAYINGKPGVVEFNPLHLGQVGLFACNVRRLAKASRKLIAQGIEARSAMTEGHGPEVESPVLEENAPVTSPAKERKG